MEITPEKMDEIHITIGKNVKNIRNKKGLSQLQLALELGYKSVSVISLGEIYKNKKHFNLIQLAKISKILNVDICEFFKGIDEILKS